MRCELDELKVKHLKIINAQSKDTDANNLAVVFGICVRFVYFCRSPYIFFISSSEIIIHMHFLYNVKGFKVSKKAFSPNVTLLKR